MSVSHPGSVRRRGRFLAAVLVPALALSGALGVLCCFAGNLTGVLP
jgi:hypothetical protein